jgi:flagellar basal-body rod protein FlgG
MADLIESARGILSLSERRMEATANNVANLTTPGFKAERLYSDVSAETDSRAPVTLMKERLDLDQGRLSKTNNPLDLAISGPGMFRLRSADGSVAYSRSGQFQTVDGGRVVNAQGMALQTSDGGDLVVPNANVKVLSDGTVLDGERPIAKVGVYQVPVGIEVRLLGGSLFSAPENFVEAVAQPQLRQGMLETSNVALADEMVSMMDALRQAESGARLVQTYDDLMGKAVSTLGQGTR